MLPFAILGFTMKPLHMKGTFGISFSSIILTEYRFSSFFDEFLAI